MDTRRDILRGFIKVHILFLASQEPVYGLGLIEELARHWYHLSPGTLYPLLHTMQHDGYLVSQEENVGGQGPPVLPLNRARSRDLAGCPD